MRGYDSEKAAECRRVVEELEPFLEEMPIGEKNFVQNISNRYAQFGDASFVTDVEYAKLSELYDLYC